MGIMLIENMKIEQLGRLIFGANWVGKANGRPTVTCQGSNDLCIQTAKSNKSLEERNGTFTS